MNDRAEDGNALNIPVFHERGRKERYQVRFWSQPEDYRAFTKAVDREGLVLQDVFNDFMVWFCMASRDGTIAKQRGGP